MKYELRNKTKIYSKELLDALFFEFYTKIPYIQKQLGVSDKTAQKYLDSLVQLGILISEKIGRERIYRNERLFKIIKDIERIEEIEKAKNEYDKYRIIQKQKIVTTKLML